jgi:serine/threonine protein kinase
MPIRPGDTIDIYTVVRVVGSGASGVVVLALTPGGAEVAIKILSLRDMYRRRFSSSVKREINIMKSLDHPNIVKLHKVLKGGSRLYLVCEYVAGGDLFDRISSAGRLDEATARKYFNQIADALAFCHAVGISHRDVKPENCMVTAGDDIKITDFGLSNMNSERYGDVFVSVCGTPNYCAPEVLSRVKYHGPMVDVWSLGVLLYVMLVGCLPFDDALLVDLIEHINEGTYSIPRDVLSADAIDLIGKILVVDPERRITLAEVRMHPWALAGTQVNHLTAATAGAGTGASAGAGAGAGAGESSTPPPRLTGSANW